MCVNRLKIGINRIYRNSPGMLENSLISPTGTQAFVQLEQMYSRKHLPSHASDHCRRWGGLSLLSDHDMESLLLGALQSLCSAVAAVCCWYLGTKNQFSNCCHSTFIIVHSKQCDTIFCFAKHAIVLSPDACVQVCSKCKSQFSCRQ